MEKNKALENSLATRRKNMEEKKKQFMEVYTQKANNIHLTCKSIGIERATFYKWMKDDIEFSEKILALEEGDVDSAETALKRQILDGNITAIIFYLKTKGKHRGYVERQELTGANGQKLFEVEVIDGEG